MGLPSHGAQASASMRCSAAATSTSGRHSAQSNHRSFFILGVSPFCDGRSGRRRVAGRADVGEGRAAATRAKCANQPSASRKAASTSSKTVKSSAPLPVPLGLVVLAANKLSVHEDVPAVLLSTPRKEE
jgi:hypothetical protein